MLPSSNDAGSVGITKRNHIENPEAKKSELKMNQIRDVYSPEKKRQSQAIIISK